MFTALPVDTPTSASSAKESTSTGDRASWTVHLTYFKASGKYYSEGEYTSQKSDMGAIIVEARQMLANGTRPGLMDGPDTWFVVIDVPNHPNDFPTLHLPALS